MSKALSHIGPCTRCQQICEPDAEGLCPACQQLAKEILHNLNTGYTHIMNNLADELQRSQDERANDPGKFTITITPIMCVWLLWVEPINYGWVVLLVNVLMLVFLMFIWWSKRFDDRIIAEAKKCHEQHTRASIPTPNLD